MLTDLICATVGANSSNSTSEAPRFTSTSTPARAQRLFAAAAVALLAMTGAASANTVDVTYVVSYTPSTVISGVHTYAQGNGPGITGNLGTWHSSTKTGTKAETFAFSGDVISPVNFLTLNPAGSCGTHCVNNTAMGILTVNFTFYDEATDITAYLTETGIYSAKYSGSYLACSGKSGSGSHQSDCIDWTGAAATPDASVTFAVGLGLDTLFVTLFNAEDWAIKPKIGFELTTSVEEIPQTPLPGALPLFVGGAGMLGLVGWRRKKRTVRDSGASA
jgi:hypothetical protein